MWGAAQLWNYLGKGHWLMEGSGRGGQSFWKLSVEFGLVGMCPRLRMVHQSARLKNIDRRKALDTPWPCKEESQPRAHSNRVWCLQRDQRMERIHLVLGRQMEWRDWKGGRVEGQSLLSQALVQCVHMSGRCICTWRTWLESQPHLAFNLFYYFLLQNNISLFNQKVYLIFWLVYRILIFIYLYAIVNSKTLFTTVL